MAWQSGVVNFANTPGIWQAAAASRPAAAATGTLFVDQTTPGLEFWNGAAWVSLFNGAGFVPTSRTLTIAGVAQDLSADRTWNVSFASLTGKPTTLAGYGITNAFANGGNAFAAAAVLGTTDNNIVQFLANNSEVMTFTTGGSVGVGVVAANVNAKMDIESTSTTGMVLRVTAPATFNNGSTMIRIRKGTTTLFSFATNPVSGLAIFNMATLAFQDEGSNNTSIRCTASGAISIFTHTWIVSNNSATRRFSIFDSANVNIGPSAVDPGVLLNVEGNARFQGTITTNDPGGGAGAWRLGIVKAGAVALDAANYIEVNIGGTIRKILIST